MPIHINLLAESRAAEEIRRRDPFKWALFTGAIVIALLLVWGGWVTSRSFLARAKLGGLQTQIDAKTNNYEHAITDLRKVANAKNKLAALDKLQGARFLDGNLLNAMQLTMVDGVQLNRVLVDQSYSPIGEAPKYTGVRERILLHLYARDFSPNPGDEINKFRDAIAHQPYFQSMLDKTNGVQLAGPPSSVMVENGRPYVAFTFECRFRDQIR